MKRKKMETKRGPGRPPGRVTDRNVNIRIPHVELAAAKSGAKRLGFKDNFSEFVREAIRRMLWDSLRS
jgi:hypothetical protein